MSAMQVVVVISSPELPRNKYTPQQYPVAPGSIQQYPAVPSSPSSCQCYLAVPGSIWQQLEGLEIPGSTRQYPSPVAWQYNHSSNTTPLRARSS